MADDSSIRVAVRIRPLLPREIINLCRTCTSVVPGEPQITIGNDKSFTYDYVFNSDSSQEDIYITCAKDLVRGSLEGYNATLLAYGQTGSGKTFTMGTGFELDISPDKVGIVPRAIEELFYEINRAIKEAEDERRPVPQFTISAQFLELHNEEIVDLFDPDYSSSSKKRHIKIHEDSERNICVSGVKMEKVSSVEDAFNLLRQGALARTTGSTQMNESSSRSHAIFTLYIKQNRIVPSEGYGNDSLEPQTDFETLSAKFHFVDLAGSERLKRTGASGDRAREGININMGLLALGNVISALGDMSKKALHVPYRDSKLTRLLQDSLGGNSRTLMIACISPADSDFMETLNTLKYSNRARNIQNKVVINVDHASRTIAALNRELQTVKMELLEYKQGKKICNEDGLTVMNDMALENSLLQSEIENLKLKIRSMQETIDSLTARNAQLLAEQQAMSGGEGWNEGGEVTDLVSNYMAEIESLRAKVMEAESMNSQLRKLRNPGSSPQKSFFEGDVNSLLLEAKKDLEKDMKEKEKVTGLIISSDVSDESSSSDSEDEDNRVHDEISNQLISITSEIDIKQRLIEELEQSQRKMASLKKAYEEKLNILSSKIAATEKERDAVLASYGVSGVQSSEKVKKIKEGYERKLQDLQREVRNLQTAQKEHARLVRSHTQYESRISSLSNEISDMKRMKVRLMKQLREENMKHKAVDAKYAKEIAQLKKKCRKDESTIKALESESKLKGAVLKRKQEELRALRQAHSVRQPHNRRSNKRNFTSPKMAKQKWLAIERNITDNSIRRQMMASLERELAKKVEARSQLQEDLQRKSDILKDKRDPDNDIREEIDVISDHLDHLQSSIAQLQQEIIQVEESQTMISSGDLLDDIDSVNDASFISERLYNMALNQACINVEKDAVIADLLNKIEEMGKENRVQEELLRHMVIRNSTGKVTSPTNSVSRSPSPTDSLFPVPATSIRPKRKLPVAAEMLNISPDTSSEASQFPVTSVKSKPPAFKEKGLDNVGLSPLNSPLVYRRQVSKEEDVFSRLTTASKPLNNNQHRIPGKIAAVRKLSKAPIMCSHIIEGHSRTVLALCATNDHLFSGSQDRCVVQWDLNELKEVHVFSNHPSYIVAVKYDAAHRLLFTVSSSFVQMWDTRSYQCIETLTSSGMTANCSSSVVTNEAQVNDIAVNSDRLTLYVAAGDKVRVWDLRSRSVLARLIGGHQAAIMCLARTKDPSNSTNDLLYTGSKDHYIKLFEVASRVNGVVPAKATLEPPHYDGIQCLAVHKNTLFSGSRDCIIKKWVDDELVHSSNNAHKDWVTGLSYVTDKYLLISACRDGTVKLWSTHVCNTIHEMKAHSSQISALTHNSSSFFTASGKEIKMWNLPTAPPQDLMSLSTGHIFQLSV